MRRSVDKDFHSNSSTVGPGSRSTSKIPRRSFMSQNSDAIAATADGGAYSAILPGHTRSAAGRPLLLWRPRSLDRSLAQLPRILAEGVSAPSSTAWQHAAPARAVGGAPDHANHLPQALEGPSAAFSYSETDASPSALPTTRLARRDSSAVALVVNLDPRFVTRLARVRRVF